MSHHGSLLSTTSPPSPYGQNVSQTSISPISSYNQNATLSAPHTTSPRHTQPTQRNASRIGSNDQEIQLLCHFRYHIAPWLDNNDPSGFFGVSLVLLARERRAVMAAVLAITSRHMLLTSQMQDPALSSDICAYYRQEAESISTQAPEDVKYVVRQILLLDSVFSSSTQTWRSFTHEFIGASRQSPSAIPAAFESLWLLWLRIGTYQRALTASITILSIYVLFNTGLVPVPIILWAISPSLFDLLQLWLILSLWSRSCVLCRNIPVTTRRPRCIAPLEAQSLTASRRTDSALDTLTSTRRGFVASS
jgi:hypothetical protein